MQGIAAIKAQSDGPTAQEAIFKVPFLPARAKLWRETAKQLYVLTGLHPVYADKRLDGKQTEPFLCFRFDYRKKNYAKVRVLFKVLGIAGLTERTDDAALIAIPENIFPKVAALFSSDLKIVDWHCEPLPIDNFSSKERLALFDWLFSLQALERLERRNKQQYDLSRIMLKMADMVKTNLNAFDYLQGKGMTVTYRLNRVAFPKLEVNAEQSAFLPAFVAVKNEKPEAPISMTYNPQEKIIPKV